MDFELAEEHQHLRSLCREFARGVIAPGAEAWNREHRFPSEVFRQLADLEFCGPLVPEEYGGSALGMTGYVVATEELGQGDQSLAAAWSAHCTIGTLPILNFGTEQQKRRRLVPLAK